MTAIMKWGLILVLAFFSCTNDSKPQPNASAESDTANMSVDEKIQASRKRKEGQVNNSSALRYAASVKKYSIWGELAMQSSYGKPAHNFGYTLLAPSNAVLMSLDQGFIQLLNEPENRDLLDQWMGYFIIVDPIDLAAMEKYTELEMANGKKLNYDAANKKLGEIELSTHQFSTNNGHLIEINNLPHFPSAELAKRYKIRKDAQRK